MDDKNWGHCRSCKFFGSPARVPLVTEEARCMHRELAKFELMVFGANGCKGWELREGLSQKIEEMPTMPG